MAALKTEVIFLSFLFNSYSFVYGKSQQHYTSVGSIVWLVLVPKGPLHIPNPNADLIREHVKNT